MKSLKGIGVVAVSVFAIAIFCSPVQAELTIGGDLEIDTAYSAKSTDNGSDETEYDLGGRIKVAPTARTEAGNLYMEATAQILAKVDGTTAVDDAYGKIGTSVFDIQIGRYEGWNLYDESNDMLIVDAPTGAERYKANYARGRMDGAGQLALHVLPSEVFGLELGLVYGNDTEELDISTEETEDSTPEEPEYVEQPDAVSVNVTGIRPVILVKFGPAEFSAGYDMLNITKQDDDGEGDIEKKGFGARVKVTFNIVTLGINYANGTVSKTNYDNNTAVANTVKQPDETTNSMGGYCDLALGKGTFTMGGSLTTFEFDNNNYTQEHNQYYLAYAHPLPIEGVTIKFAVSQAAASNDDPTIEDSDTLGFKIRLNYDL